MRRLSKVFSWFLGSLAAVLATVATLAVPDNAFADTGTVCAWNCNPWGVGTTKYRECLGDCCSDKSAGDTGADATCCESACATDPDPMTCKETCQAGQKLCQAQSGNRVCDKGCYYNNNMDKCDITIGGSITGCVIGGNSCALCKCDWADANKIDCWCKKP